MAALLRTLCLVVLAASLAGCVAMSQTQDEGEVAARVGDTVVTLADLEDAWNEADPRGRLEQLQDLYEARRRVLDDVVGERLIEREAEARGIDREELLATELPARTEAITTPRSTASTK